MFAKPDSDKGKGGSLYHYLVSQGILAVNEVCLKTIFPLKYLAKLMLNIITVNRPITGSIK